MHSGADDPGHRLTRVRRPPCYSRGRAAPQARAQAVTPLTTGTVCRLRVRMPSPRSAWFQPLPRGRA
ncbi:hypothetical protein GCM10028802_25600 [Terrabacter terrigena]